MYVCMSVCLYVTPSELFKAVYKRPSLNCLIQFLQEGLYQAASESSQVKTLPAKSVVADSNPGWTLCIGSVLCVTAVRHF